MDVSPIGLAHHLSRKLSCRYRITGANRNSIKRRDPVLISTVTAIPGESSISGLPFGSNVQGARNPTHRRCS